MEARVLGGLLAGLGRTVLLFAGVVLLVIVLEWEWFGGWLSSAPHQVLWTFLGVWALSALSYWVDEAP